MINTQSDIQNNRKRESGNVLWLILITLVLIGLLTVTLSRSGSKVEQTGDVERNRILVSQMLRFTKGIETAITNMKLQGIGERQVSFYRNLNNDSNDASDPDAGEFYNNNCTDNSCLVFHVEGGGISYQEPPAATGSSSDWLFVGTNDVEGIGSANADLVIMLPGISQTLCDQINREMDVTYANDITVDTTEFDGSFANTQVIEGAPRKTAGCLGNNGTPFFYQVLIPR